MPNHPAEQKIANNIRLARRLAGLTQEEAAHDLDVTVRTYARWENDESRGFMEHLDAVAKAFGTTTEQLVGTAEGASLDDRLEAMETELRELRELLLDPARLKAAADALADGGPQPQ